MIGCFVPAARFARTPGWRAWAAYGVVTGLLPFVFFVFISIFGQLVDRGPAGLFERLAITGESLFVALVVGRLWIQRRRVKA